jgi:hypothetical protein
VRRAEIEAQNRFMLERQRQFRTAADLVTEAWLSGSIRNTVSANCVG